MFKRITFFLIITLIVITSCNKQNTVKISGNIENGYGFQLYISDPYKENNNVLDSVEIKKSGKYTLKFTTEKTELLELKFQNKKILLFVSPGESININASSENFNRDYTVTGSDVSLNIKRLNEELYNTITRLDSLSEIYNSSNNEVKTDLENSYAIIFKNHKNFIVKSILENIKNPANVVALHQKTNNELYFLNDIKDIQYFKIVTDSLKKYYPGSNFVKSLQSSTNRMLISYNRAKLLAQAKDVKSTVPDIKLPSIKNDTVTLSSLRGKMVLLLFSTTQNEGSKTYHDKLKTIYNKYKGKGFQVYHVSFERDEALWKKYIKFEETPWVCVNDKNASQSILLSYYNITTFPTSYLLDKTQEIVLAKNLSLKQLDLKLNYEINKK